MALKGDPAAKVGAKGASLHGLAFDHQLTSSVTLKIAMPAGAKAPSAPAPTASTSKATGKGIKTRG
jgi:hypothetical protein